MNSITEEDKIRDLIEKYTKCNETSDWESFIELWHPEARRLNVGNNNQLLITPTDDIKKFSFDGLKNLKQQMPDADIRFEIDEFTHIDIYDNVVASVELKWKMFLPGSKGTHKTYFHLVKLDDLWIIVNVLDRGFEEG
jgi:hypothetical protein